jgi:protein TonB
MIAVTSEDRRDLLRWLVCGVVVIFAHAAVAAALIDWREPIAEEGEVGTDTIIVEFQPELIPTEPLPEPVPKIEEKPEPLPEQPSEAMLPSEPKLEPESEPPREEVPVVIPKPVQATASVATWKSQIVTLLEHNKRYPADARGRGEQGVAQLAFSIDRDGRVMSSRIVKSSGSAALDAETLALIERGQPYPRPPPELVGRELTLPLRYSIR